MKFTKPKIMRSKLDEEIENLLSVLNNTPVDDDEYKLHLQTLERLMALKAKPREKLSANTMLTVAGSLIGIILVIRHEEVGNVISSKGFGLIMRGRV